MNFQSLSVYSKVFHVTANKDSAFTDIVFFKKCLKSLPMPIYSCCCVVVVHRLLVVLCNIIWRREFSASCINTKLNEEEDIALNLTAYTLWCELYCFPFLIPLLPVSEQYAE